MQTRVASSGEVRDAILESFAIPTYNNIDIYLMRAVFVFTV